MFGIINLFNSDGDKHVLPGIFPLISFETSWGILEKLWQPIDME